MTGQQSNHQWVSKHESYGARRRDHFTQEDPAGLAGGLNLYGFAGGDPVNFSDPFGLAGCDRQDPEKCSFWDVLRNLWHGLGDIQRGDFRDKGPGWGMGVFLGQVFLGSAALAPVGSTTEAAAAASAAGASQTSAPVTRIFSARVLERMGEEAGPFHNFPQQVGEEVMAHGQRTVVNGSYVQYTMRGTINGYEGTYQIGVEVSNSGRTETITHWFFKPDPK